MTIVYHNWTHVCVCVYVYLADPSTDDKCFSMYINFNTLDDWKRP